MSQDGELRRYLGGMADRVEAELRRRNRWTDDPPDEALVLAGGAFGLALLRAIDGAIERGEPPTGP